MAESTGPLPDVSCFALGSPSAAGLLVEPSLSWAKFAWRFSTLFLHIYLDESEEPKARKHSM